jgi:hypothetical protein
VKATRALYNAQGPTAAVAEALAAAVRFILRDQVVTHDRALIAFLRTQAKPG